MFTKEMVLSALQTWCDNVVKVGKVHAEGGDVQRFHCRCYLKVTITIMVMCCLSLR